MGYRKPTFSVDEEINIEKYQRLIYNSITAKNRCPKNSWGYKFWNNVMKELIANARLSKGLN